MGCREAASTGNGPHPPHARPQEGVYPGGVPSRAMTRPLRAVLAATLLMWLALPALAAFAHPIGLPAFALVEVAEDAAVRVTWTPSPDDLVLLARTLEVAVDDDAVLSDTEAAALAAAPGFRDYLLANVSVSQDQAVCPGEVAVPEDLGTGSAEFRFACTPPIGDVDLTITLLLDLDPRYRTQAVALAERGDQRELFTEARSTFTFALATQAAEVGAPTDPEQVPTVSAAPPPTPGGSAGGRDAAGAGIDTGLLGSGFAFEDRVLAVVDADSISLELVFGGLLVAFAVGAAHALAPGHGKTIAAAYLIGDRGRPRDAMLLGVAVSAMHTISVLALGFVLYAATRQPSAALLTGSMNLTTGLVVLGLGVWLLIRRLRERAARAGDAAADHTHEREHHHDQDPGDAGHDHGAHGHSHLPPEGASPLSRRGLLALGAAGGLLPSPTALLVLLTALSLGRLGFGLALVLAFSIGLAATLTLAGLAVVWGRDTLRERASRRPQAAALVAWLPTAGALGVVLVGVVLTVRAAQILT